MATALTKLVVGRIIELTVVAGEHVGVSDTFIMARCLICLMQKSALSAKCLDYERFYRMDYA